MPTNSTNSKAGDRPNLGQNIKHLRQARGWNLSTLAKESGLPQSTLSKVEAGQMSLNFDKLLRVSEALGMDVRNLFASPSEIAIANGTLARRVYDRQSKRLKKIHHYRVQFLSTDLKNRLMIPVLLEVPHVSDDELEMMDIIGERFAYVVEGPVEFRCEQYDAVTLKTGDSLYVDAAMPHAFVAPEGTTARVITVLTSSNLEYLDLARQAAQRGGSDASNRYKRRNERIKKRRS